MKNVHVHFQLEGLFSHCLTAVLFVFTLHAEQISAPFDQTACIQLIRSKHKTSSGCDAGSTAHDQCRIMTSRLSVCLAGHAIYHAREAKTHEKKYRDGERFSS